MFGGKDTTDVVGQALELSIRRLTKAEIEVLRAPSESLSAEEKYHAQKEGPTKRKVCIPHPPPTCPVMKSPKAPCDRPPSTRMKALRAPLQEFSDAVPRLTWSKIDFASQKSPYYQHPTSRPVDRMQHTATLSDPKGKIIFLGGQGRTGRRLGDMWELNTRNWR